jgi:hypothetical protein
METGTGWRGSCFVGFGLSEILFRAVVVQVAALTPQAAGRLFAISPDVAKLLTVVAPRKGVRGFVRLYPDENVAEPGESEDVLGFCYPREGHKEQRQGNECSFWRPTSGWYLLDANNV